MKKYEYENATVYITMPTEQQLKKIVLATENFLKKLMVEGIDICGRNDDGDRTTRKNRDGKRRRNKKAGRDDR